MSNLDFSKFRVPEVPRATPEPLTRLAFLFMKTCLLATCILQGTYYVKSIFIDCIAGTKGIGSEQGLSIIATSISIICYLYICELWREHKEAFHDTYMLYRMEHDVKE